MAENKFQLDFNAHTVRDWEKVAQQELINKDPWQNLTKERAGLAIKPYYDSHDILKERKIQIRKSANGLSNWQNAPKVIVVAEKEANEEALNHLNSGADGVYFDIQVDSAKPEALLKNIELPYCSVYFSSYSDSGSFITSFLDFVEKKQIKEKVNGVFYWRNFPSGNPELSKFKDWKNFKVCGILIRENENIVDEIVDALCEAVDIIEQLTTRAGFTNAQALESISFSISIGTDFFIDIAKTKALKNLWFTLQEAYQIKNPTSVFVHGYSRPWIEKNFQPHGNLLKQTTAAMAAAMGGCDAITIEPEAKENKMMTRIARNVSLMLKEEANLSKVNDPLAGSFYADALTHQIASAAWKKFQQR